MHGREAKTEGGDPRGRCVTVGEVPTGSSLHRKRMKQEMDCGGRHGWALTGAGRSVEVK